MVFFVWLVFFVLCPPQFLLVCLFFSPSFLPQHLTRIALCGSFYCGSRKLAKDCSFSELCREEWVNGTNMVVVVIYTFFVGVICLFFFLGVKMYQVKQVQYLRDKTCLSECAAWKWKQAQGQAWTVLHMLFPHRRPLAQLRRDRRELWSQTGTPGKHQSRLKIPLWVRHSDTVGGVTTHTDQFEQLCWVKVLDLSTVK